MFALELKNISKTFGTFKANDGINLSVKSGEVHAILGENGAGKSTLMKIIFGLYQPDAGGEIYLKGKKVEIPTPRFAIKNGIGMVHQHFMLVRPFSILQNIILGVEPRTWFGSVNYKAARAQVMALSETYNFNIDPDRLVETISVGMQQRVEIIKTLYRNAELIILDEPTAVLTPQEVLDFYRIVENLKRLGKTIIIITHKLHEIKEIADRCTIIRKGLFIETVDVGTTSEEELASKMVGRKVDLKVSKSEAVPGDMVFNVEDLSVDNDKHLPAVKNLNLTLHRGEILGLAGIDGNGQSELVEALAGLRKFKSGSIKINDKEIGHLTPRKIYESKLAMIPEDRQRRGLVMDFKVKENFVLQRIEKSPFSHYGFIINRELEKFADSMMERFDIRPRNIELNARNLSGGNQQKIILAREIANNPDVLIAFQPTRGLDVGAIQYIHQEIIKLRDQGKAILLISYELDEVINLSDRVAVIVDGGISVNISHETLVTQNNIKEYIGLFMAGGSV
ncbi:MAG: ABC transporter ATP-binding protein [Bacteriovorax sp.]|nr:ABC transporter ATP-binding protein [Bacteriovorax sp.]